MLDEHYLETSVIITYYSQNFYLLFPEFIPMLRPSQNYVSIMCQSLSSIFGYLMLMTKCSSLLLKSYCMYTVLLTALAIALFELMLNERCDKIVMTRVMPDSVQLNFLQRSSISWERRYLLPKEVPVSHKSSMNEPLDSKPKSHAPLSLHTHPTTEYTPLSQHTHPTTEYTPLPHKHTRVCTHLYTTK